MREFNIQVELATPGVIAPYGHFIGCRAEQKTFAAWPGVTIFGEIPIEVERGGEILLVQMEPRVFPLQVSIIERHFTHTQVYMPFNGKPFVMLLGLDTEGGVPVLEKLRAFKFDGQSGIALHKETWHDFPYALESDTQFSVVLSNESHVNTLAAPEHPMEATGPDLERRSIRARATMMINL